MSESHLNVPGLASRRQSRQSQNQTNLAPSRTSHVQLRRNQSNRFFSVQRISFGRARPQPKLVRTFQPTYQLNSRKPFNVETVEKLLKRIVNCELEEVEYSDKLVPELCLTLAEMVRTAVKEEKYDRYRILVAVSICQKRNQGVHMSHSFLWDHERDAYAFHNYENPHLLASVVVYGIYLD